MSYIGDFEVGQPVRIYFTTKTGAGVASALTSGEVKIYKDDSTTEFTTGVTLTAPFDSRPGLNFLDIVTSDGVFSAGSDFWAFLTDGDVNGTAVEPELLVHWSIKNRSGAASLATALSNLSTLLSRLTSTRAGYLDNLSAGAVALEASLQALITTVGASAAGIATAVWSAGTRVLTAGTNIVLAKGTGVTGFNDVSAAQVNAEADTALSDVGLTSAVTGRIDVALSTVASYIDTEITTLLNRLGAFTGTGVNTVFGFLKALLSKTASTPSDVGGTFDASTDSTEAIRDRGDAAWLTATGFSTLDAAGVRSALGLSSANLDTQIGGLPTAAENAGAVWEEDLSDHSGTSGSAAEALEAAASGGGGGGLDAAGMRAALGMASANLDTQLAAKASQASVDDVPTNAELAASQAAADDATLAAVAALSIPSAATIADAVRTELATELGRIDVAASTRASQTSVDDVPNNAEFAASQAASDDATLAAIAALSIPTAAQVRAEMDSSSTKLASIDGKTANLPASPAAVGSPMTLTAGERNAVADAQLDRTDGVEAGLTVRQAHRLEVAAAAGARSGFPGPAIVIHDVATGTKERIAATTDEDGNTVSVDVDVT